MKREIHPVFFWLWALCLVTALIRLDEISYNLVAISSVIAMAYLLGGNRLRRSTFFLAIRLAIFAVLIRMIFAVLIGVPMPGAVLFSIPQLQLPDFLVGIRIGGEVTTQRLSSAFGEATLFAALIITFGAANSLTTPTRILKVIPSKLYGVGVAAALATTLAPQFAQSVLRVRQAQFLRGQSARGFKSWRRIGTPVLEDAVSRSLDLAAALEARGYGAFQNPSRYRPSKWDSTHTISLLPALYLATLFPNLAFSGLIGSALVALLILAPVVVLQ